MKLLLHSDPYEPITQTLLKHKSSLGIEAISFSDFFNGTEIYDEFDESKTTIQWFLPNLGAVTNTPQTFIINRLCYFKEELFEHFHLKDREYAKNEMIAYLTFALHSFENITEKPHMGSLSGGCYSLLYQWTLVQQKYGHAILTPTYYVGPLEFLPQDWGSTAIFNSLYNVYFWKKNTCPENQTDNVFAINKPKGKPILALVCGNDAYLYDLEQDSKPVTENEKEIKEIAIQINALYDYFISESLFYLDGHLITFGMITNIPIAASKSSNFDSFVLDAFSKRLNAEK